MPLKRFDNYVLREISSPFFIGLTVYSFTMLVNTFFLLSDLLISKGAPPLTVARMLLFIMPTILSLTIPMATLMGILAGLSRMSSDSEVLALRTLGVHHHRLYKPVLLFSLLTWVFSSLLSMYLAPQAQYQFLRLKSNVFLSRAISQVKPRSFYGEIPSYTLFFEDIDPKTKEMRNVFLYSTKQVESDLVVLAERGRFTYTSENRRSGYITLQQAKVHRFNRTKPEDSYELSSYKLLIEDISEDQSGDVYKRPEHMPVQEVWKLLAADPGNVRLAIDLHNRFAFPFAALVLGFLGVSLGISTRRGGRTSGFVLSLALIFIYYTLITLGRNLAIAKTIPPFAGIWGANIFLLLVGLLAFRVTSRGAALRLDSLRRLGAGLGRLRNRLTPQSFKPLVLVRYYPARLRLGLIRILDAYILRRLVFTFSLIFLSLMAIMYLSKILELIDNILNNGLPFSLVFEYIYYHTPELVGITLPIAVLTAVLLSFSLMSKQNEIITIQVSGISLHRILLPALGFGLIVSLLFFGLQEQVLPQASRKAQEVLDVILARNRNAAYQEDVQKYWAVDEQRRIFFYDRYNEKTQQFRHFNLIQLEDGFVIKARLTADSASWKDERTLVLHDGTERRFRDSQPVDSRQFTRYELLVPGGDSFFKKIKTSDSSSEFMNIDQLGDYVRYLKANDSDPTRFQAKIYQKRLYPFSCLVMVLIAIPFAFLMGRKGSMHGIGAAVIISMVFMGMMAFLNSFGSNGLLPPLLASVLPYLLFTAVSIVLMVRIRT